MDRRASLAMMQSDDEKCVSGALENDKAAARIPCGGFCRLLLIALSANPYSTNISM
jgi:hypothetical protein